MTIHRPVLPQRPMGCSIPEQDARTLSSRLLAYRVVTEEGIAVLGIDNAVDE